MKAPYLAGIAVAIVGLAFAGSAMAATITGAGSTFLFPVFAKWAAEYNAMTGIGVNYQPLGSGGGIKQVEARTMTFGASDKPLSDAALEKHGLIQFPIVMGGIVPIFNLKGVKPGSLVLDGPTLAKIYLGTITKWNDTAIKVLNAEIALPSTPIVVVHRSDGSGTTFNFTTFLNEVSTDWKANIGADTAVEWPVGIGAKGNEGVANTVKQTSDSIGFAEFAYASQNKLSYANMKNAAGEVVAPTLATFGAAAANADWKGARNFHVIITNQPGDKSWPIAASTWVLIHKAPRNPKAAAAALKFFDWAYKDGKAAAKALDYVAIPDSVVALIERSWTNNITANGKPIFAAR